MRKRSTAKKRPNKQRISRASSFKRIARELRTRAAAFQNFPLSNAQLLKQIAATFDGEAKTLRSMP